MSSMAQAARLLERARRPVVIIGPAARQAISAIDAFAQSLGAAILTTPQAKSLVDETRADAAGVFSFGASSESKRIVEAADLVLGFGTELGEFASRGGNAFVGKMVIQVVGEPDQLATTLTPHVVLVGSLARAAEALADTLLPRCGNPKWFAHLRSSDAPRASFRVPAASDAMHPSEAADAIARALPRGARLACDVTSATLHVLQQARLGPEKRFWTNIERSACMGAAVPVGIGLRTASELPTLVLIGDWGLCMGTSELHTIASLRLPNFVIVVWANAGGALIRHGVKAQQISVSSSLHTWERPPCFEQVGRGWGIRSLTVRTARGLERLLDRALRADEPVLIQAMIDPKAAAPAGDRYLYLDATASVR